MASSASVPTRVAPAKWTLTQVVRSWCTGEPGPEGDYEDEDQDDDQGRVESKRLCLSYMQKLLTMGVKTRLQAQVFLTDELCCSLDETHGTPCDVRRELLELLGVQWRQQVWSASEIAVWERRLIEPTAAGDDGPWREELDEFKDSFDKLGLHDYYSYFFRDDQDKLLGIGTA